MRKVVISYDAPSGEQELSREGKQYLVNGKPVSLAAAFKWYARYALREGASKEPPGELKLFLGRIGKALAMAEK